ncbi:urease accessory protein UreE [Celeribacter sp.]|uniref:urease accessory protein UreE n=1 Tax=Celeribacter sp. TaxID=1890673 RepID=UPI003A93ADE9
MADFTSQTIRKAGDWSDALTHCVLSYEDRFLRRKVLTVASGETLLVDLAHTTSLDHGDAFEVSDGQMIEVIAADEPLLEITGNLVQLAWHIGNRHTPCQIEPTRLLIQNDPVIGHMLEHLGATVTPVTAPFTPEGGAYGHGRTHAHAHGATAHAPHDHGAHTHDHSHDH